MSTPASPIEEINADDPPDLQKLKHLRATVRTSTTKLITSMDGLLKQTVLPFSDIEDYLRVLDAKEKELEEYNRKIFDLMPITNVNALQREGEKVQHYKHDIEIIRSRCIRAIASRVNVNGGNASDNSAIAGSEGGITAADIAKIISINNSESRLPILAPPKFSGDYKEWTVFWSLFEANVHSKIGLSKLQKFCYLRSYLSGEALETLGGMKPSDSNYDEAVSILKNRFDRPDLASEEHIEKLSKLEPVHSSDDLVALKKFYVICQSNIKSLKSLGYDTAVNGAFLCPKIVSSLPKEIRLEYTKQRGRSMKYDIDELLKFLGNQLEYREACERMSGSYGRKSRDSTSHSSSQNQNRGQRRSESQKIENKPKSLQSSAQVFTTAVSGKNETRNVYCIFCKANKHASANCSAHSIEDKKRMLFDEDRCFICIRYGHRMNDCPSEFNCCRICKKKHNMTICDINTANKPKKPQPSKENSNETAVKTPTGEGTVVNTTSVACGKTVLLQTAQAMASNPLNNKKFKVRCLLDNGSQASFITEEISNKLNLPVFEECDFTIRNFGNNSPVKSIRKIVTVVVENVRNPNERVQLTAIVVPYICEVDTTENCKNIKRVMKEKQLQMADEPSQDASGKRSMDILIGADSYWEVVRKETERFDKALVAVKTKLGWTIQGPAKTGKQSVGSYSVNVMHCSLDEKQVSETLKSFWELESLGINDAKDKEPTAKEVLKEFESETKIEDGRYSVKFPWKVEKAVLSDNYDSALQRMKQLVKRFEREPKLYQEYKAVIKDQLQRGIAEEVKNPENKKPGTYFMPHQPVVRDGHATTKVRVVFDASNSKGKQLSLNGCLEMGENFNPNMFLLLLRFRKNRVAVMADIEKAFLQVALQEDERNSVRFLWIKEDEEGKIIPNEFKVLQMARVPFGVTASTYLLAATLKIHIAKYESSEPEIFETLNEDIYVDDFGSGAENAERAFELSKGASIILNEGKFKLRKWQTNSEKLRKLWTEETANPESDLQFDGEMTPTPQKFLGLRWNPEMNTLAIEFEKLIEETRKIEKTKRFILSTVSKVFDPIGIIAPFTIRAKFLMQKIWLSGKSWDETLPEIIMEEFQIWVGELSKIKEIEIPRFYYVESEDKVIEEQLHCFTDASIKGYAAVLYVRYVTESGNIAVSLVTSKTRVAPTKTITLPRLELMGCLLGARLVSNVKPIFKNENINIKMWTDSTVALHWIKGSGKELKPFVRNRTVEIQELVEPSNWAHCPGKQNPADLPTRGATPEELKNSQVWFHGPAWLSQENSKWPKEESKKPPTAIIDEEKRKNVMAVTIEEKPGVQKIVDLERYSSVNRALKVIAQLLRFSERARKLNKVTGPITADELARAEEKLIGDVQEVDYEEEISNLKKNKMIPRSSKIAKLDPILNDQGLVCVGGRLEESDLTFGSKHPIIIDKSQKLAHLLMVRSHEEVKHSGIQATITQARERYWIPAARQLARNVIRYCRLCKKYNAKQCDAPMGRLPEDRIVRAPPFQNLGVDFAGPLIVKTKEGTEKSYICLFTCTVTRGVHLELVPSLTTYQFLLAINRLIARRGIPHVIYSDNARTFVRANEDLKNIWKSIKNEEVLEYFGRQGIRWKFIVERASWWGGMYERMVKTTKATLRKTLGRLTLTYPELETVVIETEAVVNSRPISYVYNDVNEPEPLTPADFLIGQRITALPPIKFQPRTMPKTRMEFAKLIRNKTNLIELLWKRWKENYLLELRTAHYITLAKRKSKIMIGDVMIVEEDNVPRHMWKLGVVHEIKEGRDKQIRHCMVKMGNGKIIKRPIKLLYALEVDAVDEKQISV